jgi:hypothetical protein
MAENTRLNGWSKFTHEMTFSEDRETEIGGRGGGGGGEITACFCMKIIKLLWR